MKKPSFKLAQLGRVSLALKRLSSRMMVESNGGTLGATNETGVHLPP